MFLFQFVLIEYHSSIANDSVDSFW